jgi:hypothetical protein
MRKLFSVAVLAALLAGCDDAPDLTEDPIPEPEGACDGVECDDGLDCDPFDGLCKCGGEGGVVCPAGDACLAEPTPTCVATRCSEVTCDGGESSASAASAPWRIPATA